MASLWMLLASLLFACMGVCVKLGAAYFSAGELVFYRGFVATLIIGGIIAWRGLPVRTVHVVGHVWRSLAGFAALVAYFYAITLIPLATAVTLSYTSPLFLALLLIFWLREAHGWRLNAALGVGFAGVVLVLQPTLVPDQWFGGLLGLCSGIAASIAFVHVRRLGAVGEPEWRTVFYFSLFSALGGLPWALASGPLHMPGLASGPLLLGVGGFGVAAQWCMTAAYSRGRTLSVAALTYSTVVFASIFGLVIWHERLPAAAWGGVVLIIVAGLASTVFSAPRRAAAAEL